MMEHGLREKGYRQKKLASSLVMLCVTIMLTAVMMSLLIVGILSVNFIKHENMEEADEYLNYLVNALKVPLWRLDTETTRDICDSLLSAEYLVYIEVKDDLGNTICKHDKKAAHFVIERGSSVYYNSVPVGSLLFRISYAYEIMTFMAWLGAAILFVCLGLTAVVFTVYFFVQRNIAKPLGELLEYMRMISEGRYEIPAAPFKYEEFATIMDFMTEMASRIKAREHSLKEITDRLRREVKLRGKALEALRESEEKFRAVMYAAGDGVVIARSDGRIEYVNRAAEVIFEMKSEDLVGSCVCDLFPEISREKLRDYVCSDKTDFDQPLELTLWSGDKKRLDLEITVSKALYGQEDEDGRVIMIIRDISLRRRMEKEREEMRDHIHRLQKIEAIATLAAGIAHDFNNVLTVIMGFTELAKSACKDGEICGYLEQIERAGTSARDLVKQILSISRPGPSTLSDIDLKPFVKETVKFIRSIIPSTIQVELNMEDDGLVIRGDPSKIQQVIINLCTNAVQAMEGMDEGILKINLYRQNLSAPTKCASGFLPPGEYVCIEIADTGPGIPSEIMDKIFDPYFTTKKSTGGTGLGLAVVRSIVSGHRGDIAVESTPGRGTVFRVFLPRAADGDDKLTSWDRVYEAPGKGRGQLVVFVDDDPLIVDMAKRALESWGYNVKAFTDSEKAQQYIGKNIGEVSVLVTDITMPGIPGHRLLEYAKELKPDLPVIVCTGYVGSPFEKYLKKHRDLKLVYKPYTIESLAGALSEVLNKLAP